MSTLAALHDQTTDHVKSKINYFLENNHLPSPCLIVDLDQIRTQYQRFVTCFPKATICYAVKANPAPEILETLAQKDGSYFDVASLSEISAVLKQGVSPSRLSYGNTIKKENDIKRAYALGVRVFTFDSSEELAKIARSAPGSEVFCRVLCDCGGADWPLSRKFGCSPDMALWLMKEAASMGFRACGLAFHVGSQQGDVLAYDRVIDLAAHLSQELKVHGIILSALNIGGGFPAHSTKYTPPLESYAAAIEESLLLRFGGQHPRIILEPGRGLVGNAGILQSEIVLISQKSFDPHEPRWIYLDIGKFGGLIETMDEAIRYPLRTQHDGGPTAPCVIAGPTCDSADTLYEKVPYELPLALKIGDKVFIESTGAYTTTYSSVGFNGFPPLPAFYI